MTDDILLFWVLGAIIVTTVVMFLLIVVLLCLVKKLFFVDKDKNIRQITEQTFQGIDKIIKSEISKKIDDIKIQHEPPLNPKINNLTIEIKSLHVEPQNKTPTIKVEDVNQLTTKTNYLEE